MPGSMTAGSWSPFDDPVSRLAGFSGKHLGGLRLGIVLRPIAEAMGVGIVVPRALVAGDAVDDLVADIGMLKANTDQLGQVARADPNREATAIDRLRCVIAYADAQESHPVLVGIKASERLTESLHPESPRTPGVPGHIS